MQDFFAIPDDDLRWSARYLRKELQRRGWTEGKYLRSKAIGIIFAKRPDGKEVRFCSCFPYETTVIASRIADDKILSYEVLKSAGVDQPETVLLSDDEAEMRQQISEFLAKYPKIVIKPVDGAHGWGVVTGVTDIEEAVAAAKACNELEGHNAMMQEQLPDGQKEVRTICIDGKFVAAYERIPAAVTGDGVHSVMELIDIENETIREAAYHVGLPRIDVEAAHRYLKEINFDNSVIPAAGEKVRVMGICNVGMGGTVKEVELSPEKIELSERIAKVTDLPVLGVDFLGDKVIEINAGPALYWPTGDGNEDKCVKVYADYLDSH